MFGIKVSRNAGTKSWEPYVSAIFLLLVYTL